MAGHGNSLYYFLFSLERMAVVYDLKTVGETDWYAWGLGHLAKQDPRGSWGGDEVETCFALLFLNRANVARDLTLDLKGLARDPAPKLPGAKLRRKLPMPSTCPSSLRKTRAGPNQECLLLSAYRYWPKCISFLLRVP